MIQVRLGDTKTTLAQENSHWPLAKAPRRQLNTLPAKWRCFLPSDDVRASQESGQDGARDDINFGVGEFVGCGNCISLEPIYQRAHVAPELKRTSGDLVGLLGLIMMLCAREMQILVAPATGDMLSLVQTCPFIACATNERLLATWAHSDWAADEDELICALARALIHWQRLNVLA